MKISLVVLTAGKMMGKEIPITAAEFRIGKDPSCQLKPATGVSDKHCAFLVKQGKLFLVDLGSAEGTFVNDNKISAEVELKPKDKVKVGPLLFEVKIEAPAANPAVAAPAAKPAVATPAAKPAVAAPRKAGSGFPWRTASFSFSLSTIKAAPNAKTPPASARLLSAPFRRPPAAARCVSSNQSMRPCIPWITPS